MNPWLTPLPSTSKPFPVRTLFARKVDSRRRVYKGRSQLLQSITPLPIVFREWPVGLAEVCICMGLLWLWLPGVWGVNPQTQPERRTQHCHSAQPLKPPVGSRHLGGGGSLELVHLDEVQMPVQGVSLRVHTFTSRLTLVMEKVRYVRDTGRLCTH